MIAFMVTACGGGKAPVNQEPAKSSDKVEEKGNQEEPKPQVFQEMTSSITTIDGWEKDEDVPSNVTFYKKDGFSVMLSRDRMPEEANTPEKFLEYVQETYRDSFSNVEFHDTAEIGVSDPDKHFLVYTYKIMNMELKGWNTYIFHDKYAYTLGCGGSSKDFPTVEEDFRTFIESFELVEK